MFEQFTKILQLPVILHKTILDENILLITQGASIYIVDRTDIDYNNTYTNYIDLSKIPCTVIKESFYLSEHLAFKYLNEEFLHRNEDISYINRFNSIFTSNNYTKAMLILKLEKINDKYVLIYYYNNKYINKLLNNTYKNGLLIYLLEKAEKLNILNKSNLLLNDILNKNKGFKSDINNDINNNINEPINSTDIFNNITLFEYQKNDILYFKTIENNVILNNNNINYMIDTNIPILNNKYMITADYMIYPNIKLSDNFYRKIKYYGGNIISEMGLGKTLIVLYSILSDKKNYLNLIPNNIFIDFSKTCCYFYKLGVKKGSCCDKELDVDNNFFCNQHKKSIFIDKKSIILKNMDFFNIKYYLNDDIKLDFNNYYRVHHNLCKNLLLTKSTLIICPSHLCDQWIKEYYNKCNQDILSKTHVLLVTTYNQYCNLTVADILFSDIILVSYNFLVNTNYTRYSRLYDQDFYSLDFLNTKGFPLHMFYWNRIVFDEFHEIRNMNNHNEIMKMCTSLQCKFKWNISGTPFANGIDGFIDSMKLVTNINSYFELENTYEKSNIHDILNYGLNTDLIQKTMHLFKRNTKASVAEEYTSNIINNKVELLEFTKEERSIYDSHLVGYNDKYSKFLLQLCCHSDLFSETKHLVKNCKTLSEIQQTLIEHNTVNLNYHKKKINMYTQELNTLNLLDSSSSNDNYRISTLKRSITNEKKIYESIKRTLAFLEEAVKNINNVEMCPICLDDIKNVSITTCGHKFCWDCFNHYSKVTAVVKCPNCNNQLTSKDIFLLQDNPIYENDLDKLIHETKSTKIGNIIYWVKQKLIDTEINNKIIIFSQWEDILNKVGDYLKKYNINTLYCKGTVYQKNKSIKLFNESNEYNIILLCSRNAASGINLTKANNIIFIEPVYGTMEYRTDIENQAIGRCVRIGNKQNINVIRFIINNTIESEIINNTIDDSKLITLH